jgi:hypothetical protein
MIKTLIDKDNIPADWPRCPKCSQPLKSFTEHSNHNERFSITIRSIFGWCDKCNKGCEIEQFDKKSLWHTSRFRIFRKIAAKISAGLWQKITDLPIAAIVIGPAKEYDVEYQKG